MLRRRVQPTQSEQMQAYSRIVREALEMDDVSDNNIQPTHAHPVHELGQGHAHPPIPSRRIPSQHSRSHSHLPSPPDPPRIVPVDLLDASPYLYRERRAPTPEVLEPDTEQDLEGTPAAATSKSTWRTLGAGDVSEMA